MKVTTKHTKNKVNQNATKAMANPNKDESKDLIEPVVEPGDRQNLGAKAAEPVKHNTNPFPNTGDATKLKSPSLANIEVVSKKVQESIDFSNDLKNIFEKQELDLSEEFFNDLSNLLEAAVDLKVTSIAEELEEIYTSTLAEELETIKEDLEDRVDNFLAETCNSWAEDNQLAIEYGVKNELTESFIEGLKTLFENHYVDIPESKYDVVQDLEDSLSDLKEDFSKLYEDNATLLEELDIMKKRELVFLESEGLTEVEKDKFYSLAENLMDADYDYFSSKISTIKENHFPRYEVEHNLVEDVYEEGFVDESSVDPIIANIAATML